MSFLNKIFSMLEKSNENISTNTSYSNISFHSEEYKNERIEVFKNRYDLTSIARIKSIPVEEAKRYPDGGKSVVYIPEQILSRQATEYKKEKKYDLAV